MASFALNNLPLPLSKPRVVSERFNVNCVVKPIVVSGNPPTFVSAPGRRIVAVGDLHGDLFQTRRALVTAGILSTDGRDLWTGGDTIMDVILSEEIDVILIKDWTKGYNFTVLVQLGDILDRGDDEIAILSLLRSLNIQAKSEGGAVFQVIGNHETMNVEGDFRYVDPGAYDECMDFLEYLDEFGDNCDDAFLSWINVREKWRVERRMSQGQWSPWSFMNRQKGLIARASLFRPGGLLACELARHAVVLKVDDWVFCHGGLLPHHVAYGVERMNREISEWMQGFNEDSDSPEMPFIATRGYDSVVWNRIYSRESAELKYQAWKISSIAEETLEAIGAKGMVVGHTPQSNGANCKYDQKIWCIDVGMSSGVLNSRPEVLEIVDDNPRILRHQIEFSNELDGLGYL